MSGRELLLMLAGPLLWMAYFTAAYAAVAVGCALRWPQPLAVASVAALTAFTLVAEAWLLWASRPSRPRPAASFGSQVGAILAALSLVATVWVGASLLSTGCGVIE